MQIHPYAWLVTVPLTIAMVQLCFQPAGNVIRRWWLSMLELEAEAWFRLRGEYRQPEISTMFKRLYVATIGVFSLLSVMSFCVFVEVLPASW